jgi:aspartyl-tRNA(Asn)/glutamyl-tRNA(Gln) amidotransferase subunit A
MDKVGILARSARDIAVVLGAIAGPDGRDETAAGRFVPLDTRSALAAVKRVRIGFSGEDVEQCEPVMHRRLAAGLAELQRTVPRFTRAEIRSDLPYATILELVLLAEAATIFAEHLEAPKFDLVDERQRAELRSGLDIRARDYLQAMRMRQLIADDFRRVFRDVDVIVSAGRSETAPWLDRIAKHRSSATVPDRLRSAANLAGVPGVFFPVGLADDGMPVGLQLVGPPRSEPLLLAIAAAFQRESDHHLARPPLA